MIKDIIRGTTKEANNSSFMKGWVVGHMHEGIVGTPEFEVKLWHYSGPIDYGVKTFGGTELIVVYGGRQKFIIEDEIGEKATITLCEGEYLVFPPGIKKEVVVETWPAFGVCVRWPSGPGVNKVLK